MTDTPTPRDGQPIVFRNGIVLTMDDRRTVHPEADVLVVDGRIAEVGPGLTVPDGTFEIDAKRGIVMPGMVDTHRHMWQSAMRAYGADWTLTQYFVWYYLTHGAHFRPEDIAAGNLISALDSIDAGVTTTVDWSHGLRTVEHAEAALESLATSPGRYVFAPGNIFQGPWEWTSDPDWQALIRRGMDDSRLYGMQIAFDVTGDPEFPERAAFEAAREFGLTVTTHAGVWGATNDASIDLMYEGGFMTPGTVYVHAATLTDDSYLKIAATGGTVSLSTESEESCGQGYPPSRELRKFGIPVSMSVDTSVWFSGDLFSAMRTTLGAERAIEHYLAHQEGETVTNAALRAEHVVEWSTRGGAFALGKDSEIGSLEKGKLADVVLLKNDDSPAMTPIVNPYGHIVFQASRGDVDTVLVGGTAVKFGRKLVAGDIASVRAKLEDTVEYLKDTIGEDTWNADMTPEVPESKVLDNPYTYTDYRSDSTHAAR